MHEPMTRNKAPSMREGLTGMVRIWAHLIYVKPNSAVAISAVPISVNANWKVQIFDSPFTTVTPSCLKDLSCEQAVQSDQERSSMVRSSTTAI